MERKVVIIGAGPAGLTAAWETAKHDMGVEVIEQYHLVGGIARTESYKGYSFDIGGHRFFTKAQEAADLWRDWMGDELLTRTRRSRIYYKGTYFHYPLKALNALFGLGLWESVRILCSYVRSRVFPYPREDTFEEWVSNRFGRRLYEIFFKTYTEKVWGMPCSEIRAEWAAQRIKGLSLPSALRNALFPPSGEIIKTLIEEFQYPKLGPGMMWERVAELVQKQGATVHLNSKVTRVVRDGNRVKGVVVQDAQGDRTVNCTDVISTMPLSELITTFEPPPPIDVIDAARRLEYRDFLTVLLIIDKPHVFPDNWIYIHSPDVQVGRIQNFKNWSPHMVPDPSKTSIGMEYFCAEGDPLWQMEDQELVELAKRELAEIGISAVDEISDGVVVRQRKAYPVYNAVYEGLLDVIKDWLGGLENFQTIGRNGLHKYNNQDHSMITAILAVRSMVHGEEHDVWEVNTERSYHEEIRYKSPEHGDDPVVDILEA